jgi:extracellular elastinolytic metalloproteinase
MNLYLFTVTNPSRDGSFDAAIPIHEYTHGISNRLTGGPSNVHCLQTQEAAGLGEVFTFNKWDGAMHLLYTCLVK